MKFENVMLGACLLLAILTMSAVSASDNVTSDDLSIGLDDSNVYESPINRELLDVNENSCDADGQDNAVLGESINAKSALTDQNTEDILSDGENKTLKINFYKQAGDYVKDKKLYVKVTDADTGEDVYLEEGLIRVDIYNADTNKKQGYGCLDSSATVVDGGYKDVKYSLKWSTWSLGVGNFIIKKCELEDTDLVSVYKNIIIEGETNVKVSAVPKIPVKIDANALSTTYKSGKYFNVKIINSKTKKAVEGVKVILKVYTGKKAKTVTLTSNSKGIVKYSSSKLNVGKHKVMLNVKTTKTIKGNSKTSSIKVSKAALKISAPSKINTYKKAGKFTVMVKNKASGKALKGIKVTMKVYTGKKHKTCTVKTNSKGKASFSTKSLSKGKHKIAVTANGNSNFKKASKKSSVTIVKSRISTSISRSSTFMYRSAAGHILGGDGVFYLYAGGKELKNKKIDVYSGSEHVTTIKSGVSSFIPVIYGTLTFKYAGTTKYMPCSYKDSLFTYVYSPSVY